VRSISLVGAWRGSVSAAGLLLLIEFLDEVAFGSREAAWPLIRSDLGLSYAEVGLLLALPTVASGTIEPLFGVLGDAGRRKRIIVGGGVAFAVAFVLAAVSNGFWMLLGAFALMYPASGAFVSLSQASLMDASEGEHEQAMARWGVAGSLGVVLGPLALAGATLTPIGWRWLFVAWAAVAATLAVLVGRTTSGDGTADEGARSLRAAAQGVLEAARSRTTWRWLGLLAAGNLMLDGLFGFLALYLVDGAGLSASQAAVAIGVWTGTGLAGDALLIPLLRRVRGLDYLRVSAVAMLGLYAAFLVLPGFGAKVGVLGVMGLLNAGWYTILQAQLYASLPGRSGAVVAISAAFGMVEALIPLGIGLMAEGWGITAAMVVLGAGPIGLVVAVPRRPARVTSDKGAWPVSGDSPP